MPIHNKIIPVTIVLSGGGGNRMGCKLVGHSTLAAGVRGPRREDKHHTGLTKLG